MTTAENFREKLNRKRVSLIDLEKCHLLKQSVQERGSDREKEIKDGALKTQKPESTNTFKSKQTLSQKKETCWNVRI